MSEPNARAKGLEAIAPGVYRWHVKDDRIGGAESDAFAVVNGDHVTLIDPLPIDEDQLRKLGAVDAIVLTAGNHQRSAWRFRKSLKAKVYAPENALGLLEKPDYTYAGGDLLPGGLTAFHAPGPVDSMHALWLEKPANIVFVSDLLTHDGSGGVSFVPSEYQDEPARTRESVRRIADDIPAEGVAFAHGPPVTSGARKVLEDALARDNQA